MRVGSGGSTHIREHCGTPAITRHWRNLGPGAVWGCTCGQLYRLHKIGGYEGHQWVWRKVKETPDERP